MPSSRRRWLAGTGIAGTISIDAGAAVTEKGTSILPVGINTVDGDFTRGDTVSIVHDNKIAAAWQVSAVMKCKLIGIRLEDAHHHINHAIPKSAVHRDNFFLVS